jgi:hypothetical protein
LVFKDGHPHNLQEEHHSGKYCQALLRKSVDPFSDTTDHHLQPRQQVPQHMSLWSLFDTKLTKSTTFHPQTDNQIEVINRIIVHIMRMYNSKHLHTWDESLPYVQHNYNRALHSSSDHSPFQVELGFQPLGHIDVELTLATPQTDSSHVQSKTDKATKFIEQIHHIHQHVHEILQKANAKYKQRHDQHMVPHKIQVGDKV